MQEMDVKALFIASLQVQRTLFFPFWGRALMPAGHRETRGLKTTTAFLFWSLLCFFSTSLLIHPEVLRKTGPLKTGFFRPSSRFSEPQVAVSCPRSS